jgi:predicted alpha/beta-fold hydrolase
MYSPARWLPGPHLMTAYANLARVLPRPRAVRERWELPDGDFLDVDRFAAPVAEAPLLVVCHGLESSSRAPYVRGLVAEGLRRGLGALAMNFRSCSGTLNRLARFYHSGDTGDLAYVLARLVQERPGRPIVLAGFSLGGNVITKWLGEDGDAVPAEVKAASVISVPFDLASSARIIDGPGFWSWIYRERFLFRLRQKALAKARLFPDAIDAAAVRSARTFADFDAAVTAPLHGFANAEDYWRRSSAGRYLSGVRRPLLAIASLDDPMVPPDSLPVEAASSNPWIALEVHRDGGHVGFVSGVPWRPSFWAERRACDYLVEVLEARPGPDAVLR